MIGDYENDLKTYKEELVYAINRAKAKINTKTCMCNIDALIATEIDCKTCCFDYTYGCVLSERMYRLVK